LTPIKPKSIQRKRFIAAESDFLVLETVQTDSLDGRQHLRILKLKGTWRANEYNQFIFEVSAKKGPPQVYIFKGIWKLNKNQQIEYTSADGQDTLLFKGYWQISPQNRLVYLFEGSSTSRFEFRAQIESPTLLPKKGQIRYRLGVGIRKNRLTRGSLLIVLYGEWKIGRNLELLFEMDYGEGKIKTLEFGAGVTFGRNKVIFVLKDQLGQPLGITLTMTHKFLESLGAQVLIRLKSCRNQHGVEAEITVPF